MTKRIHCAWVALFAASLTGCGEGNREFLSLGTAGTGGVYYPIGGAIASRMSVTDSARQYTAEVTGGSVENVNRMGAGQMDLGIVMASTAYEAYRGEADFQQPISGLRAIAPLYPNVTHIVVPENSDGRTISDFRGMRVSVGSAGSGTEQSSRHVLLAHGLDYDDINPQYLTFSETSSALMDGAIGAGIFSVGFPAAAVLEVTTTSPMRLMGIEPEVIRQIEERYPYYSEGLIPAGAYRGMDQEVRTVVVMNWIVAMDTLDDDVVTTLLNLMQDDRVALEQVHEMAKQIDLRLMAASPIPLHPAAERWYAERFGER
jgi:TRAP transporter TAXI family solute receptor